LIELILSRDYYRYTLDEISLQDFLDKNTIQEGYKKELEKSKNNFLAGEFIVKKSKVHIRLIGCAYVFKYTLKIEKDS